MELGVRFMNEQLRNKTPARDKTCFGANARPPNIS